MFSLLSGFYEFYARKPSFNILIIGLDSAGKTTLLERIKRILSGPNGSSDDIGVTVPTVGLNVSKCDLKGVQCQFWDLGGGGDLPKLWSKYYSEAHAVLFVIDSLQFNDQGKNDNKEEEEAVKLFKILSNKVYVDTCIVIPYHVFVGEFVGSPDAEGVPVAILANKQDLIVSGGAEGEEEGNLVKVKESFNPIMSQIEARESKVFGVSALKGSGVMDALEWVLGAVEKNFEARPPNFV